MDTIKQLDSSLKSVRAEFDAFRQQRNATVESLVDRADTLEKTLAAERAEHEIERLSQQADLRLTIEQERKRAEKAEAARDLAEQRLATVACQLVAMGDDLAGDGRDYKLVGTALSSADADSMAMVDVTPQLLVPSPENPAMVAAAPGAVTAVHSEAAGYWAVVQQSGERRCVEPATVPVPGGT